MTSNKAQSEVEWTGESDLEWMGDTWLTSEEAKVNDEWEGEGSQVMSAATDFREACICDPCDCDPPEPAPVQEQDQSKDDPNACSCEPCECVSEPELVAVKQPSCPTCCAANVKCTCYHPPPEEPKDPLDEFMHKLEDALVSNQKKFCHSVFTSRRRRVSLTEGLVLDVLISDANGKLVMYLPGNQLCPKIITERIRDRDMKTISNVMRELRGVSTISLPYNKISDVGLEILASIIEDNPTVEHLNLMNNQISGEGLLPFCLKIMNREPLKSLRLSGNALGDMGYEALSCLVLSGHLPGDLDVGETDMSAAGFQAFCAALMALDADEESPPHYVTRGKALPMDLEILKQMKIEYNEAVGKASSPITEEKSGAANLFIDTGPDQWHKYETPEKVQPVPNIMDPEVVQKFSATALQTLFDISQNITQEASDDQEVIAPEVAQILEEVKGQGDLNDIIAAFNSNRLSSPQKVTNYREIPILSPDLYKIEPTKAVYHEFLEPVDDPEKLNVLDEHGDSFGDFKQPFIFQGHSIDPTESILAKDIRQTHLDSEYNVRQGYNFSVDENTATAAAKQYLRGAFNEAAGQAGASGVNDQSNTVQLVLMTIVEIVRRGQQVRISQGQSPDLTEDDCRNITEEAIDRVMTLLKPKVPPECELSEDTVRIFIESLFENAEGTFKNLLENPFMMEALYESGTMVCHLQSLKQKAAVAEASIPPAPENKMLFLATKFLDGIFEEAARLIGTGDPFNYRSLTDDEYMTKIRSPSVDDDLSDATSDDPITSFVKDVMDMGQNIGMQALLEGQEARQAEKDYDLAAELVVDDLFDHVQKFLIEKQEIEGDEAFDIERREEALDIERSDEHRKAMLYPFVSRPQRLVLNRPLFHPGQVEVLAEMLGDYLKNNTSVKILHIQKWMLNEPGMLALMERLMPNRTLVVLDMSNNEIGPDGTQLLAEYVKVTDSLKHLILSHNRLRDPGILHLAQVVAESSLESLNIAYNDLTAVGLDILLENIPRSNINALYIWGNVFGTKTWKLYKALLVDSQQIKYTDTLIQETQGQLFLVKNGQVRDRNYWYNVPMTAGEDELVVPPYLQKQIKT